VDLLAAAAAPQHDININSNTMDDAHGYEQPRALRKWRRHHWIQ